MPLSHTTVDGEHIHILYMLVRFKLMCPLQIELDFPFVYSPFPLSRTSEPWPMQFLYALCYASIV